MIKQGSRTNGKNKRLKQRGNIDLKQEEKHLILVTKGDIGDKVGS